MRSRFGYQGSIRQLAMDFLKVSGTRLLWVFLLVLIHSASDPMCRLSKKLRCCRLDLRNLPVCGLLAVALHCNLLSFNHYQR